jgi:hypothetical protein
MTADVNEELSAITFDANGLVPAIVQDDGESAAAKSGDGELRKPSPVIPIAKATGRACRRRA